MADTVEILTSAVDDLLHLVGRFEIDLESGSKKVRRWSALRAAMRESEFREFSYGVENMKVTVVIAQQYCIM